MADDDSDPDPDDWPVAVLYHPKRLDRVAALRVPNADTVVVELRDVLTGVTMATIPIDLGHRLGGVAAVLSALGLVEADVEAILRALDDDDGLADLDDQGRAAVSVLTALKLALERARARVHEYDA